ncbi:MAG: hypothetical protein Tsb005_18890 [Gammaproteobacteria bacterium]
MQTILKRNYAKLMKLAPELWSLERGDALKSRLDGYMDLNLDVLHKQSDKMRIALSHYYKHDSGDLIADPDMELQVCRHEFEFIEALAYQDCFGYQRVYVDETHYYPKRYKSLNNFLSQWLSNCLAQGHRLKQRATEK